VHLCSRGGTGRINGAEGLCTVHGPRYRRSCSQIKGGKCRDPLGSSPLHLLFKGHQ
jgi:hypothetical protein